MRNRNIPLAVLSSLFVVCGCQAPGDPTARPGSLTAPLTHTAPVTHPSSPPQSAGIPNWQGDATVVSVERGSSPPCGWGTSPGETRSAVEWRLTVTADSIALDEDMRNWPTDDNLYSGHLDSAQFAASYAGDSNYAASVCQFRGGTLTGHFTSDSTFEAVETLVWGTPGTETTVTRNWKGSRL
jgi:hypothetical protein